MSDIPGSIAEVRRSGGPFFLGVAMTVSIKSLKQRAREKRHKFYYTGKPCRNGHYSKRYTKDSGCVACKREKNRGEHKKYKNIKHLYGLEKEEYLALVTSQKGRCAICNKRRKLVVDHCHTHGYVRGQHCNTGIGHLQDCADTLRSAIKYLQSARVVGKKDP